MPPAIAAPLGIALAVAVFASRDLLHLDALGRAGLIGLPALIVCASVILTPQPKQIGRWWRGVALGGDASYALYIFRIT